MFLEGTITVFECSDIQQSKYSDQGYYKVAGKLANVMDEWISEVKLDKGVHDVKIQVSKYQGKTTLRIASIAL